MLEMLANQTNTETPTGAAARWETFQAGVRACSLECEMTKRELPCAACKPLEAFFCTEGELKLEWEDGRFLRVRKGDVLLLSEAAHVARLHAPDRRLSGVLLCADSLSAAEKPSLLSDGSRMRPTDKLHGGCAVIRENDWASALFSVLGQLPREERGRYCAFKLTELLYLIGRYDMFLSPAQSAAYFDGRQIKITRQAHDDMLSRLDEHWTIDQMAQRYHTSATLLKSCFRYLYGKPIHRYLRQRRLEHAAELLTTTSLSMVDIAAAVGYGSASQFGVSFKSFYHMSPSRYRKSERSKMSEME